MGQMMLRRPGHQGTGSSDRIAMSVCFMLGQDMPNSHQHFAGDGNDSFILAQALGERLKNRTPIGRKTNSDLGGSNQSST
jgi:hypothetical protein